MPELYFTPKDMDEVVVLVAKSVIDLAKENGIDNETFLTTIGRMRFEVGVHTKVTTAKKQESSNTGSNGDER